MLNIFQRVCMREYGRAGGKTALESAVNSSDKVKCGPLHQLNNFAIYFEHTFYTVILWVGWWQII